MQATTGEPRPIPSSRQRHQRSGFGITAKIFLSTVGVVVLAIGGAVLWTSLRANHLMEKGVRQAFASTTYVFDNIQESRHDRLKRLNALVAEDPTFAAVIVDTDAATVHDDLLRRKESLGADLVIVANAEGALLARTDGEGQAGQDLTGWPMVAKALQGETTADLLAEQGHLFHAVALPVVVGGEELAGVLVSGYLIDDRLANEMKRTTGTEVAFISSKDGKPALAAATMTEPERVGAVLAFAATAGASESAEPQRTTIGGESYLGVVSPLKASTGERAGSLVILRSIAAELANFNELRRNILLIGVVALLVAMAVSFLVASRMTGPLRSLVRVADAVTDGQYDVEVPAAGGDEVGALAAAIKSMVRELREKAELEQYLAELGGAAATRAHRGTVAPSVAATVAMGATAGGGVGRTQGGTPEPMVGATFAGRYDVLEIIGQGGMGKVYKVHDRQLDDVVALKTIRKEALGSGPDVMERFKQEIKLARKATHKNILRTYDFGDAGGVQYLTMEYVKGITLRDLLQRQPELPVGIGLRIARQICNGLNVAHEAGIVHRDVKSQNILIQASGELKIMDFGIARTVEGQGATGDGVVMGTPEIMAPEQAMGLPTDPRSDIYSAGCVFFELFTGRLPFVSPGNAMDLLRRHVQEAAPALRSARPALPAQLEAIVARMLEKDPTKRFQSFADVHAALDAVPEKMAA